LFLTLSPALAPAARLNEIVIAIISIDFFIWFNPFFAFVMAMIVMSVLVQFK
jgi:hypothetical protein